MDVCISVEGEDIAFAEVAKDRQLIALNDKVIAAIEAQTAATRLRTEYIHDVLLEDSAPRLLVQPGGAVAGQAGPVVELLARSGCLRLENGQLIGTTRRNQNKLDDLLSNAAAPGRPLEVLFTSDDLDDPLLFVSARCVSHGSFVGLVLLLREPARKTVRLPDLMRLFDLTRAECQIVSLLLNGMCVASIARAQSISEYTVRTHLKRCYSKLEVRTKEQLFAKLLRLMVD